MQTTYAATERTRPIIKWATIFSNSAVPFGLLNSGQEVCNHTSRFFENTRYQSPPLNFIYVPGSFWSDGTWQDNGTNYGRCVDPRGEYPTGYSGLELKAFPVMGGASCPEGFYLGATGGIRVANSLPDYFIAYGGSGLKLITQWGPFVFNDDLLYCEGEVITPPKPTLTLTRDPQTPPDPRPLGTGGNSTQKLTATVTENGQPKQWVAVTFKSDVVPLTGGHGHHDASRPEGSVPASGVTDANGEIKVQFQASQVAGSHNITATCDSCSNKTAVQKVDVRVPDLQPVSANPPRNPDGTYAYALTAHDPTHVGTSGGRQRGEYYLTQQSIINLEELVRGFREEGWGIVALNDASLNWGGVYDILNNWSNPHMGHRLGEEIDISFVRSGNFIGKSKQNEFYDKFCQDKKGSIPFTILHHYLKIPHFHVYLTGKKQCGKTAN